MRTNIYLDIDGVLIAKGQRPANYVNEFLRKVLVEHPDTTFWLTTRCNDNASVPMHQIGHLFETDVQELMKNIKATPWKTSKTNGIDFSMPFLWFDDNLFHDEKRTLVERGVLDSWIEVNLIKDPNTLAKFINSFPIPSGRY
jgi:hypothetical protein